MSHIALFYGSTTGMTEDVAFRMEALLQSQYGLEVSAINIIDLDDPRDMFLYDKIILGIPTWNYGEYQDDWEMVIDKITQIDLSGKSIALFGLGDQVGYPEYYLDAMGMLAEQLAAQGAQFIGEWPSDEYRFERSKALRPDKKFVGLALDEDGEPEKTNARIEAWLAQIMAQWA